MIKLKKRGFTLVEMLMVVIIIGILAVAILPNVTGILEKARDSARTSHLQQISTALYKYFDENGQYPSAPKCTDDLKAITGSLGTFVPEYLERMPKDPQQTRRTYGTKNGGCGSGSYAYSSMTNLGAENAGNVLVANLERDLKAANFVLDSFTTSNIYFSGGMTDDVSAGKFGSVDELKQNMCEKVVKGSNNKFTANGTCTYSNVNAMVYVLPK